MQTSLRKMGNSIGMIVPRAVLAQIGAGTGTRFEVTVEDGRLVASPLAEPVRAGWAAAAATLADEPDTDGWQTFGNEDDDALTW